jgi:hypothetical protein
MNRLFAVGRYFTMIAILALYGNVAPVSAATQPQAPPQVCVNNVCSAVQAAATASSTAIKWHPGHYVISATDTTHSPVNPTNQSGLWSGPMSDMRSAVNPATGKPGFTGWVGQYSWFYLEYPQGTYNTTLIDADLAKLAAYSAADGVNYKLVILVMSEYWLKKPIPTTPQGDPYGAANGSISIAPDYIINGISGDGSDEFVDDNTTIICLWRPAVMAKYIALLNYLGSKYDGNPNVEAIVPISEVGLSISSPPSDYSPAQFNTQYETMAAAMSTSWPTTNKLFNDNWGIGGESSSTMVARYASIAGNRGWGFGGPDVIYMSPYGVATPDSGSGGNETTGEAIIRGEGGNFGTSVYKGTVGLGFQVQANAYSWVNQTSAGTESYGYSSLGITHFMWEDVGTNGSSSQQWASGIVPALKAVNFRINSACPTKYPSCNTQ